MNRYNELDEAAIRVEFRRLYKELGVEGMLDVVYQLIISASICLEIIKEEKQNEKKG